MTTKVMAVMCSLGLVMVVSVAQAQQADQTKPVTYPVGHGAYNSYGEAGLVCGAGASNSDATIKPTVQCGGSLNLGFLNLEAGVMGPQASQSAVSGYLSTNLWVPLVSLRYSPARRGVPIVIGGYTRMFETGSAVDYGVGYAHPVDSMHSIQFDVRDYWVYSSASQHNVVLRVSWLVGLAD